VLITPILGYKLRDKIGKALKTRAETIKKALDEYNRRAASLDPPRPSLTWSKVIEVTSIGDFDLWRNCHQDIRQLQWAQPANREAMNLHFRVKQAKCEIERLNVEIQRLLTYMYDDHADYNQAIRREQDSNPFLAHELAKQWQYRQLVNEGILSRLLQTSRLVGFSGKIQFGHRIGRDPAALVGVPFPYWAEGLVHSGVMSGDEGQLDVEGKDAPADVEDDETERDALLMVDFMENLAL
jgi:hypothetical protein